MRRAAADQPAAPPTWSVRRVNAPLLWQRGIDGNGVLVAVLDTGVNYNHPDLRGQMWQSAPVPRTMATTSTRMTMIRSTARVTGRAAPALLPATARRESDRASRRGATIMAVRVGGAEAAVLAWSAVRDQQWRARSSRCRCVGSIRSNPDYPGWRRTCETICRGRASRQQHRQSGRKRRRARSRFPTILLRLATVRRHGSSSADDLRAEAFVLSGVARRRIPTARGLFRPRSRGVGDHAEFHRLSLRRRRQSRDSSSRTCARRARYGVLQLALRGQVRFGTLRSFGGTSSATPHVAGCLTLSACACLQLGQADRAGLASRRLSRTRPCASSASCATRRTTTARAASTSMPRFSTAWRRAGGRPMSFRAGFVQGYLDPLQVRQRMTTSCGDFPSCAGLRTLPFETHGYWGERQDARGRQKMVVLHVTSPRGPRPSRPSC